MKYQTELDNIIDNSAQTPEERDRELIEYSRQREKHVSENGKDARADFEVAKGETVTDLPGLRTFFFEAGEMIAQNPDKHFGALVMDIHQFKSVNDFCGRKTGDRLLGYIASLFRAYEETKPLTLAGHARADVFVLCTELTDPGEIVAIAEDMYERITSFNIPFRVLPSFGIYSDMNGSSSVSYMKDCATIAMSEIKGKFYKKYAIYDEEMRRKILREKKIQNDLLIAFEKDEFKVYVQPKVDMNTEVIIGGEALVRWHHQKLGVIPPTDFIPIAENDGLIISIDFWVWEQVFIFIRNRMKSGKKICPVSINISRVHMYNDDFVDKLITLCLEYDVPPEYIILELTESAFSANENLMIELLNELRRFGFHVSMDDFGTGLSSMQMLTKQPLDEIKIDRSFINSMKSSKERIVLENIIRLLKEINIPFIAEGVETSEQKNDLLTYGCNNAQGFLFYKPMPLDEFEKLLDK